MPGLLSRVRCQYGKIKGDNAATRFKLVDCLMSGLAMFGLKYPSLLQFDEDSREDERIRYNLKQLYGIEEAPSDTQLRARLDPVSPRLQPFPT